MKTIGVTSRGIKAPIIKQGDNLVNIVVDSVLNASKENGFLLNNKDIVAVTESIVARAQGNYCNIDDIATDIKNKFNTSEIGVIFPILSRNRFAICLKGIARSMNKIYLMLSYPSDEVGNHLFDEKLLFEKNINTYADTLSEPEFRELFGYTKHQFTGIDYIEYYKNIIQNENCECEIIFSNTSKSILNYSKSILNCNIHNRNNIENELYNFGAEQVLSLDDIMTYPINGSGYNPLYGLLGSNKSTEDKIKLFPIRCYEFIYEL